MCYYANGYYGRLVGVAMQCNKADARKNREFPDGSGSGILRRRKGGEAERRKKMLSRRESKNLKGI